MEKLKLLTIVVILSVLYGCKEEPVVPVPPKPDPTPIKVELTIYTLKTTINRGEETEISWVTNGTVTVNGQKMEKNILIIKPEITTKYVIASSIGNITKTDSVTIEVIQPDPVIVERSIMMGRAPWTLSELFSFDGQGKCTEWQLTSSDSTNLHYFIPTENIWKVIDEKGVKIGGIYDCHITRDSLFYAGISAAYQLTDTTLFVSELKFQNGISNLGIVKYKREK
jgi:hypothetical protein